MAELQSITALGIREELLGFVLFKVHEVLERKMTFNVKNITDSVIGNLFKVNFIGSL